MNSENTTRVVVAELSDGRLRQVVGQMELGNELVRNPREAGRLLEATNLYACGIEGDKNGALSGRKFPHPKAWH